jgi:hypothetical protein
MSEFNLSVRSKEDQDRIAVDLAASGVAFKAAKSASGAGNCGTRGA